jgi:L-aminopeptidase/D-esterase-like protein
MMRPGPRNLITDVAGLRVGNAEDRAGKSGATVVLMDTPAVAGVAVVGGAPGTRETDLLSPEQTVGAIDALVLSGGSAFGLDAAGGVMEGLLALGRGYAVGTARVPIVPAAILFDLLNGGDKPWLTDGSTPPYRALGRLALDHAGAAFEIGSSGAGAGATTATLKGGLGSASTMLDDGSVVGALVAVNALGQVTVGDGPHFWAAPFEIGDEFGGLGLPSPFPAEATRVRTKGHVQPVAATTIAVVATDVALDKRQARRLAIAAHDGLARAVWPAHTPFDGDLVFAVSTGRRSVDDPDRALIRLGACAAATLARAIARGVYLASMDPGDTKPTWADAFAGPR